MELFPKMGKVRQHKTLYAGLFMALRQKVMGMKPHIAAVMGILVV
jgi:hypothetical protein